MYAAQTAAAARMPCRTWPAAPPATAFPASWSTATTSSPSTRPPRAPSAVPGAGEGPTLIECKTYRWRAHTERIGQPDFRTEEEIASWKKTDPIARVLGQLKAQGAITDVEWQAMGKEVLASIESAVAFAEASPFPKPEQALEDMYAA